MNSEEFVTALRNLTPSNESLEKIGLEKNEIVAFSKLWLCTVKANKIVNKSVDPIIELINFFDCSKAEITGLTFYKKIKDFPEYLVFAEFDMDLIAINKQNNTIVKIDYERPNFQQPCAINSEKFLDALIKTAEYNTNKLFYEPLVEADFIKLVDEITMLSGTAESEAFYRYFVDQGI